MSKTDDKYLLPSTLDPPPSPSDAAITPRDPAEIYLMFQTIIHERPHIQTFMENMGPQEIIGFMGWLLGLMYDQCPDLYKAVLEAAECGKDVAKVLRGQIEKAHGKHALVPNALTVIYPTNLLLHQFDKVSENVQ